MEHRQQTFIQCFTWVLNSTMWKRVCVCVWGGYVCVCVCASRYVTQGCGNSILPETRPQPPPHKITAQVFNYWSLIRQMVFKLITSCSSVARRSDQDGPELYFRCHSRLITDQYSQDAVITVSSCYVISSTLKVLNETSDNNFSYYSTI